MSENPDSNIIPMREGDIFISKQPLTERKYCGSNCKKITIDGEKHVLTCDECGQEVDPFTYVMGWANEGDRRLDCLKRLDIEIKTKGNEVGALKREYEKIRGAFDKENKPLRQQIEADFNNAKWNPHTPMRVVKDFNRLA